MTAFTSGLRKTYGEQLLVDCSSASMSKSITSVSAFYGRGSGTLYRLYVGHVRRLLCQGASPPSKKEFIRYFINQAVGSPLKYRVNLSGVLQEELLRYTTTMDSWKLIGRNKPQKTKPALKNGSCVIKFSVINENVSVEKGNLGVSDGVSTRTAISIIISIFVCSILALTYIYFKFPELQPEERQYIKLPWDVEEAKNLGRVLEKHKDRNYYEVLTSIIVTYIFLQTFAIPGSISLSILSGFLFPFPLALGLVCFCSATGASFCYLLSHLAGRRLVYKYFPDRAVQYSLTVQKHRHNIFNYILFLRITPFLPNWFINIAAPIVNVPILPFWFGTFLGVAPPSFVAIQAGQTLQQLTSMSGTWSWTSVTWLAVFSILSLAPVLLRQRLRSKFD